MGSSSNESNSLIVNMKYLAVIAIALFGAAFVAAEPEAEAAAHYYGHYGYGYGYPYGLGYGYGGYYDYPYRYGFRGLYKREAEAEPEADADAEADASAHYRGLYKREAEAEAEAAPAHPLVYAPYAYAPYAYAPYAPHYAVPAASSYQHVSTPAATHGISQIHKREAEADPAVLYGAYYPGVAHHGLGATSYTQRSPQGLSGYYPYRFGYGGYYGYYGYPYLY